jgi:hypothetical protein
MKEQKKKKKQEELLTIWNSLKEQITNKIYELKKSNYILESDQQKVMKEVEKIVEIPVKYIDQAIGYLQQLRMNCILNREDGEIREKLNRDIEILLLIYNYDQINEIDWEDELKLRKEIKEFTAQNVLLEDYLKNTILLLDKIYYLVHGVDPSSFGGESGPTVEEVD